MRFKQSILVLFLFLILLLVLSFGHTAVSQPIGPKMWQESEAGINELFFAEEGTWVSYRLPPEERLAAPGAAPVKISLGDTAVSTSGQIAGQEPLHKEFYLGPDPIAYRQLLRRETALLNGSKPFAFGDDEYLGQPQKSYLGIITTFKPGAGGDIVSRLYPVDTADPSQGCSVQSFTFGALTLGDDPPPGKGDNFTFYKEDITVDDYRSAVFGTGSNAGYGVVRQDLGGVNLAGYSLNTYLKEMNYPGSYQSSGDILPDALVLPHAHEYYGYAVYAEDGDGRCTSPHFSDGNRTGYLQDALQAVTARYDGDPALDWSRFDSDGDQIIDHLGIIHAGYGFQEGGGEDRLSTSSSSLAAPVQVVGFTTPGDASDDYYVQGYSYLPENLDVGAIQEEFEHQFGIADYYSTDASNSNASWTSHSSGVWGGPLGGSRPVGGSLHQGWLLGRKDPLIIDLDDIGGLTLDQDSGLKLALGRARYTPQDTEDGVIIRLPREEVVVENLAGSGTGWYSGRGELLDRRLTREFDLRQAAGRILFTVDAWWDIEAGYDFLLVEFSADNGRTWIAPDSVGGKLSDEDAHGKGIVTPGSTWGLTGSGQDQLQWDLSRFSGQQVAVRLRYLTDTTTSLSGVMVDNIRLAAGGVTLYENDLESDFSDWTSAGWQVTPAVAAHERYYLLEWRDDNGYDRSLNDPYWVKYSSRHNPPPARAVDRLPATTPVLIVSYRDQSQAFDYRLLDDIAVGNSIGPKFGHLVVDAHPLPQQWDTLDGNRASLVGINMSGRVTPGDAGFGRKKTERWVASINYKPETGHSKERKEWPARAPVSAFHDSYGYYPGLFHDPDTDDLYFWDIGASAVLPAAGAYSTRITDVNGDAQTDLYGQIVPDGMVLGSGNPGDDHVQYGLHVEVLESRPEYGVVRLWRSLYETRIDADIGDFRAIGSRGQLKFWITENIGGKLERPRVVVTLPDNVRYAADSAAGGFYPVEPDAPGGEVKQLRWARKQDIGTATGIALGRFDVERTDEGTAVFQVDLFLQDGTLVQSETVAATFFNPAVYLPAVYR